MIPVESEPTEARQQLLNRILASREFAHAHTLKRILRYLYERSTDPASAPPKEYDIAVQAMGRPGNFDPRTDPVVRVSIGSIRDRLLAYFATEGKDERLRLTVPKGHYLAVFSTASTGGTAAEETWSSHALMRFWRPYLTGTSANVIVYTEPLFFRDDEGHYFRDWNVNDLVNGPQQLRERLPVPADRELKPSFHYLSAGEVHCMMSLSRMFHEMGVPVETRNSRISSWNELHNANLILLGSPRTNSFLATLQGDEPFAIDSEKISSRAPDTAHSVYRGRRYLDGKLMRMTEYAIVTRRPGLTPGTVVTMIAANHGRAIEGAGHLLTLQDRVEALLGSMGLSAGRELSQHFQLLMEVETIDIDDEVAQVRCIDHRVIS